MKTRNGLHMRAPAERGKQQPKPPPLRPACEPALATRSPALAVRRDFRHFVTAITGGGWVLCEVKALSHGTKGQSNAYHRFGYCRRDRIRRLVGLYGCAVEAWEGGCACGVGSDLTACDYVALASRRNTGRILTERYRHFRATCKFALPRCSRLASRRAKPGSIFRGSCRSGRPTRRRATNRLAEPEPGRRRRGSMSSRVRPDGAAALLAGGPVRARRARREVDGRRFFVGKGQFTADVRAVVVTVRGILDHFAQQGASGHGMVFAQNRCHAS